MSKLDEFYQEYVSTPYSPASYQFDGIDVIRGLVPWLDQHYRACQYFNGFSIARQSGDRRRESVIVRCSCGDFRIIPPDIWHCRIRGSDLEDIIEDLNYECRDRPTFNMKERVEYYVNTEIKKRQFRAEYEAKTKRKETQDKNGLNPIFDLELE